MPVSAALTGASGLRWLQLIDSTAGFVKHRSLPRCCQRSTLLPAGSRDCTVKLWDLHGGMELSSRRSPVGSVRSIVMDEDVLVRPSLPPSPDMRRLAP